MSSISPATSIVKLSFALERIDPELRDWLRTQPVMVRGVVDLAIVEDNATLVAAFAPRYQAALDEISAAIAALGAESWMSDREWLTSYYDGGSDRGVVERECERLRDTVRVNAQLVASLHLLAGAA